MKRPLALSGFAWLATQLACTLFGWELPLWAPLALAAVFVLCAGLLLRFPRSVRRLARRRTALVLFSAALALAWQVGWRALIVSPAQALAGRTVQVEAVVLRTYEVREGERAQTDLQVTCVDGKKMMPAVTVKVSSLPLRQPGDRVRGELRFSLPGSYDRGRGFLLRASAVSELEVTGRSNAPRYLFARLQQTLSLRLRSCFTPEIGGVAAAVCLGDRTALPQRVQDNYRRAGVSHLLVVSGLHLSLAAGAVGLLLPRRRKLLRGAVLVSAILAFMALTGFSPSVCRAGVMALFVAVGELLSESADPLTSLGAAALGLTAVNPAASADVGLLLSFSATLGVLAAGGWARNRRLLRREREGRTGRGERLGERLLELLAAPAAASLATLPVLVAVGGGVSVFSVLTNLITVPLLAPLLALGLFTAVTAGAPVLAVFSRTAALLCGLLIRLLNAVTGWVGALPFGVVYLEGLYPLAVILCGFVLGAVLFRLPAGKRRRGFAALAALFLLAGALMGRMLSAGTVRVALVGATQQPAVVITRDGQAAVLWRGGRTNTAAVENYLERQNVRQVALLVDGSGDASADSLLRRCAPLCSCDVKREVAAGVTFCPFDDIILTVRRQGEGDLYLIDASGVRLLCATGKTDLEGWPGVDVFLAGTQLPSSLRAQTVLLGGREAGWVDGCGLSLLRGEEPAVWLRPGGSIKFLGVG